MLASWLRSGLEALAPLRCVECGASGRVAALCAPCAATLPWWRRRDGCPRCGFRAPLQAPGDDPDRSGICPGCDAQGSPLHACHALLRYEGRARFWIPTFKGAHGPFGPPVASRRAIDFLTQELAREVDARRIRRPDLVVPIPLHPRRRRRRGFNQGDRIARGLARALELPWDGGALARTRDTQTQAGLAGARRRENVRGAFRATRRLEGFERVWLVDDVLTTGATLDAAAEALLAGGVEEVHGLALAATRPRAGRRRSPRPPPPPTGAPVEMPL